MIHLQETDVWRKPVHWEDDYVYVDEKNSVKHKFSALQILGEHNSYLNWRTNKSAYNVLIYKVRHP